MPSLECPCEFCFKVLFPFKFESMISYTSAHFVPSVLHFFPLLLFVFSQFLSHTQCRIYIHLYYSPTQPPLPYFFIFFFYFQTLCLPLNLLSTLSWSLSLHGLSVVIISAAIMLKEFVSLFSSLFLTFMTPCTKFMDNLAHSKSIR